MNEFNPKRLEFARKRRGLTRRKLSVAMDVSDRTLANFESGHREPPEKALNKIAEVLKFPTSFFFLDDPPKISDNTVSFRSLSRMSAGVRDSALCAGQIALEFSKWIDSRFEMPVVNVPDLREYEPEMAAVAIRQLWNLGERPIKNMVHLLEAMGTRVFSLVEKTEDMDAFSFWKEGLPFIFLNTQKSVERSRFDAAHELGHLVLHRHGSPQGKEAESDANNFASAFLMSDGSVRSCVTRIPTLSRVISLKQHWLVSAAALIRRMKDLGLLTEWNYRSLMVELSKKYSRRKEPNPIQTRETSKVLGMVFKSLREDGITKETIARNLNIFPNDLDSLLFNLAVLGMPGGGNSNTSEPVSAKRHLKLIK